jgi:hypothetical protein
MDPGRYGISINPVGLAGSAASNYRTQVREHLTWISRTKVGSSLLNSIRFHRVPVDIQPYTAGDCNSVGGSQVVGGVTRGIVRYSPNTFSLHGACSATQSNPNRGLFWDEILFHELVHVLRAVSGKWSKRPLRGGLHRYDDTEEFYAVMITNIYISDPTNRIKTGLRANHQGFSELDAAYSGPFGLYSASTIVFDLVKQFVNDNHGFSTMVANSKADFNPIADYYASPDRAAELSRNAVSSDVGGLISQLLGW